MKRILALCLVLVVPLWWAVAQEGRVDQASRAFVQQYGFTCSAFTSDGKSLTTSAIGSDLRLEITPLSNSTITLHLSLNGAGLAETASFGPKSCGISFSSSNRHAAIGMDVVKQGGEKKGGILIALVNLETNQLENEHYVESRQISWSFPRLAGFLGDSETLVVLIDTVLYSSNNVVAEIMDVSNGRVKMTTHDLGMFAPVTRVFFDTPGSLVWVELDPSSNNHRKSKSPTLQSIYLTDDEKLGPSIDFANLHHEHHIPKWVTPAAVAFPTRTTVVLAESGWSAGFGPSHLWVADLSSGSVRGLGLPRDIGAALLHGLGLTWFEDVKAPAVLSPDGRFIVIPIELTTIGPPYIVDNYVNKGSRLVIVDLQHLRILSSISPEHNREPVGFALDHRDGKVTLLVNWHEGWKRLQFADSK
jgi:hypothetical protein